MTSNLRLVITRRRQRRHAAGQNNHLPKISMSAVGVVILSFVLTAGAGLGSVAGVYAYFAQQVPPPEMIELQDDQDI
jgi:hypothetical protein